MNSITKRWLTGSLLITVMMLIAAEALFLYNSYHTTYDAVRQSIQERFYTISGQLEITTGATADATARSRSLALRRMVEQFDDKDKYELMLLDRDGQILSTSSGQNAEDIFSKEDFTQAVEGESGTGEAIYQTGQNERVLSMTMLVPYVAGDVAALRMVTSLTLVDQSLSRVTMISLALVLVVLLFSLWSGLFFVRSIVQPLHQVEATATSIARGDLDARLPEAPYDDEIGRLCKTINQMAEDLSKTDRMKNEFISSVSHELRTPLTSIKGWVETIAAIRDPEDENYRKGIAIIGTETERLYTMVEELLDFSRLQTGIKLNCEMLDLVAELTDVALFVEARMTQEQLKLEYEEPEVMIPVWADPNRLRQVFINLLDNAIKYSEPGGTIRIELLTEMENAYVAIQDEGRGISPEDLENVKLKFFKGKNAVRGSGIGLAVVDEIMRAMNGELDIASTLGKGTRVTVRLPLYKSENKRDNV